MLRWFRGDLHIHTVLSPCSDLSMGPRDIVRAALEQGLDFIAITDHNSADNVKAVSCAAQETALQVIPGIEVSTREEIHMISLFPALEQALSFQAFIYDHLPEGENDPSLWGPQLMVDKDENILGENMRLLALPVQCSYEIVMREAVAREGIVYPAHIDRRANSMARTLGFIPADLPFKVVELSQRANLAETVGRYAHSGMQLVTSSDAHDINQIGSAKTWFKLEAASFPELLLAFRAENSRLLSVLKPEEDTQFETQAAVIAH
jgi:3',5'-nucleoside bisphosphate phosphatase